MSNDPNLKTYFKNKAELLHKENESNYNELSSSSLPDRKKKKTVNKHNVENEFNSSLFNETNENKNIIQNKSTFKIDLSIKDSEISVRKKRKYNKTKHLQNVSDNVTTTNALLGQKRVYNSKNLENNSNNNINNTNNNFLLNNNLGKENPAISESKGKYFI